MTTLSFDIAALELFLPLVTGGRVVLAEREVAADPRRLAELIRRSGCTVMQATPATWGALVEAGWSGSDKLKILCGGEALSRELADQLLSRGSSVWNMYGPTETTIWSVVHKVRPGVGPLPIGRPIANTRTYLLDALGNPVPVGLAGDLYIGGTGLARGYRNREELTRDCFVTCPAVPGERLYRTGDLARYRDDGLLEFLGRTDQQLKIRGFRIAPEEIEAALTGHPDIGSAAVRAWQGPSGERSLVAYFVPAGWPAPEAADLRQFLKQILPDYMVPSRFEAVPALPMTPNGKVDRRALPEPQSAPPRSAFVPPCGEQQERLALIWKQVLRVDDIGVHDDFFDLGGHSLLVAKLLWRIELEFGQRLPMAALFLAPTIAQMAVLLSEADAAQRLPRTINLQPKGTRPPLFWLYAGPIFRALAEAIGSNQPFLGVELDPAEEREIGASPEFVAVAPYLARTIRQAQPTGPYYIGGWCAAGILAYEVAAQLVEEGQEVGLLLLLDAVNPVAFLRRSKLEVELSKLKYYWAETFQRQGRERWSFVRGHLDGAYRRSTRWVLQKAPRSTPPVFFDRLELAAYDYKPRPYTGNVAVFQSRRPAVLDCRPGWAEVVTGELSSYDLPRATHEMLEQPHVQMFAAKIDACLRRAQTSARDSTGAVIARASVDQ